MGRLAFVVCFIWIRFNYFDVNWIFSFIFGFEFCSVDTLGVYCLALIDWVACVWIGLGLLVIACWF